MFYFLFSIIIDIENYSICMSKTITGKKYFLVIGISFLFLLSLTALGLYFCHRGSLKYENITLQEYYLKNYSKKKFVKKILNKNEVYNERKMLNHIINNFDNFLTTNENLYDFIVSYTKLYNDSFDILSELRSTKIITLKDYKLFKDYLNNFKFDNIENEIKHITLKKTSNDVIAKKKYFEGIVAQLNFKYNLAKSLYLDTLNYNMFESKYYNSLGKIYTYLYDFNSAIDTYTIGLNIADSSNNKNRKKELELLYNLAYTYDIVGDYHKSFKNYSNLLINSINLHNDNYEWLAIYNISNLESKLGNYSVAIDYLKYALKLSTKTKNKQYIAKTLNSLSNAEYLYGDYKNGKRNSLKAIKFAKKISDLNLLSESSFNACLNYEGLNKTDLAKLYCTRAININNKGGQVLNRPEYYIQNANIYYASNIFKNYDESLNNLKTAYELSKSYHLLLSQIKTLIDMSKISAITNDEKGALLYLNDALDIEHNNSLNYYNQLNDYLLGYIYLNGEDYNKSITYFKKSLANGLKNDNNLVVANASSYLSMIYFRINDFKSALKYSMISLDASSKIYRYDNYNLEYQKKFNDMILNLINNNKNGK